MVLVNFIGCPSSGKTTTSAILFSDLKSLGITCEFVPEQARFYIAKKKLVKGTHNITLSFEDQVEIMKQQLEVENMMLNSLNGSSGIIVSDSSPVNSLLYMSDSELNSDVVKKLINKTYSRNVVYYVLPPVYYTSHDPNRLHSFEESKIVHSRIPLIKDRFYTSFDWETLSGTPKDRASASLTNLIARMD